MNEIEQKLQEIEAKNKLPKPGQSGLYYLINPDVPALVQALRRACSELSKLKVEETLAAIAKILYPE